MLQRHPVRPETELGVGTGPWGGDSSLDGWTLASREHPGHITSPHAGACVMDLPALNGPELVFNVS